MIEPTGLSGDGARCRPPVPTDDDKRERTKREDSPDPMVAVHESGHALARLLTAPTVGLTDEQALVAIALDGSHPGVLASGNPTTWGPPFSRTLADHIKREIGLGVDDVQRLLDDDEYGALLAKADAADVIAWLGSCS